MQYIIGLDVGTSTIKALVFSAAGETVFTANRPNAATEPQVGYHEQDPEQIFNAVVELLRLAIAAVLDKSKLSGICFSAAMHSIMAVEENGRPISPLITWADTRSAGIAESLQLSREGKAIYAATGAPIHAMLPLCKIAWIRAEQPELFARAYKFISIKEFLLFRFFGRYVVDYSIAAASGLFDAASRQWNKEALAFAGIDANRLSLPVSPYYALTGLNGSAGAALGLERDIPFITGASDGATANIGSGAVLKGEVALTIGTSGAVRTITGPQFTDKHEGLFNYRIDEDSFLTGGAINNGGNTLAWFARHFVEPDSEGGIDYESTWKMIEAVAPGSDGLLFLPYLHGERAPVWDARARGAFVGVTPFHTRAHFAHAVMEGICFSLLSVVKTMESGMHTVDVLYASGGFTRSAAWLQALADITGKSVKVCSVADASAMGAALMGMRALGLLQDWAEVKQYVSYDKCFYSNPANHQVYLRNFSIYDGLYNRLKTAFAGIDALQRGTNRTSAVLPDKSAAEHRYSNTG